MQRFNATLFLLILAIAAGPAAAVLNEFSVADGYMSPFSTRVWTYNSLWSFDGGTINSKVDSGLVELDSDRAMFDSI